MEHDIIISPRISSLYDKNKDLKNFRKDSERKKERKKERQDSASKDRISDPLSSLPTLKPVQHPEQTQRTGRRACVDARSHDGRCDREKGVGEHAFVVDRAPAHAQSKRQSVSQSRFFLFTFELERGRRRGRERTTRPTNRTKHHTGSRGRKHPTCSPAAGRASQTRRSRRATRRKE